MQQSVELAVAAEELGADGAYLPVRHFARQLASPFPLLAAVGAPDEPDRNRHRRDPPGLPERIRWGAGTGATAERTAQQGTSSAESIKPGPRMWFGRSLPSWM